MTPEKFKEDFDHAKDVMFGGRNDRVVIVTNNPSVGGRYRIPVSSVNSGFDWESGDIIISVDEEIYSKEQLEKTDLSKFIYSIDTKTWDKIRRSQSDAECRRHLKEVYENKKL